jgi:hypothetical protein
MDQIGGKGVTATEQGRGEGEVRARRGWARKIQCARKREASVLCFHLIIAAWWLLFQDERTDVMATGGQRKSVGAYRMDIQRCGFEVGLARTERKGRKDYLGKMKTG